MENGAILNEADEIEMLRRNNNNTLNRSVTGTGIITIKNNVAIPGIGAGKPPLL